MLKFPRIALGRLCLAAFAFVAAMLAASLRPVVEPALRDGAFERSTERLTTEIDEIWESGGDFNGVRGVKTARPSDRRGVERLRAGFDERLCAGAIEFWSTRRSEPGADVALRAVADGWARWNVGTETTARFLETLTASERSAFERRRRSGAAFDFAAERSASTEASQEAATALVALKSENGENGAEFDGGVDAALAFLRSLDGNENAADGVSSGADEKSEPTDETFLWASSFEGNPLNAVGALAASDVVAVEDASAFERAFAASATLFFLSTFGALGGAFPQTWTFLGGVGGDNRLEREFWRLLDAAFRRLGVALANWGKLLSFARLALFNAFRRFAVEDGTAKRAALAALCASTRLLD